eukprot:scaffold22623_cov213-Cylindrotheca_fusiformis.AAC.1
MESLAMICVVVWVLGTLLRKITYLLVGAPCSTTRHRSWLKKALEKRIVKASDGSALRNTRSLHLPRGRRHATRHWYVPQHKRGTRVRAARICHSCVQVRRPARSAVALTSTVKTPDSKLRFDTDSYLIAIDSCASYCMTNHELDFVPGSLTRVDIKVKGLGKNTVAKYKGTVRWKILQDDRGQAFTFDIEGALLLPTLPFRLLSPQHWAQHAAQRHGKCTATTITRSTATLRWNGGSNVRTVELTNSNIAS